MRISDWSSDVCSSDLKPVSPHGKQLTLEDGPPHRARAVSHRRRGQPFLAELAKALRFQEAALIALLLNRRRSPLGDSPFGVDAQLSGASQRQVGWAVLAEGDGLAPPVHPIIELESEYPRRPYEYIH